MEDNLEKIIQIAVNPSVNGLPAEFLALTDTGRLFRRYGLVDLPSSQWELMDLPVLNQREKDREYKPENSEVIKVEIVAEEPVEEIK